jgi:catechol 2,3-dioxygenase-like lactoylglutathione lyase family enzyme
MSHQPMLAGITGFRLVTADLPALTAFYCDRLGFTPAGSIRPLTAAEMEKLGLKGGGLRQDLRLGDQTLALEAYEYPGRPYPGDGNAASLSFQHLALVVTEIGAAFERLGGVASISLGGPQHLPVSSGGVYAVKFRDPDGHPLELLQFSPHRVPSRWRQTPFRHDGPIGIDHSAISVSDPAASLAFYTGLGLTVGERTLNDGPSQQRLDGLADAAVDVVPLIPSAATPHLELLGYHQSRGAPSPAMSANDVAATRIVWEGQREDGLFADPDGHLHQVMRQAQAPAVARAL